MFYIYSNEWMPKGGANKHRPFGMHKNTEKEDHEIARERKKG